MKLQCQECRGVDVEVHDGAVYCYECENYVLSRGLP